MNKPTTTVFFDMGPSTFVKKGFEEVILHGRQIPVEYELYKQETRNPEDPDGDSVTHHCVYIPKIRQAYVNLTEEQAFEDFKELYSEDFIRFVAQALAEAREEKMNK